MGAAGGRRPARPPAPRGRLLRVVADRAGARVPDLDDVRRRAGAAGRRGRRQGVDAAPGRTVLRPRRAQPRDQDRGAGRDGHDGEAGRLRRPRQPDPRDADDGRRVVPPRRPQVVHLGSDERRLPRAGAGRRRDDVLRRPARARGRHPQPDRRGAAQGQARQPVQRVERARAHRHARPAPRRRGPRRPDDHRDGRRHPPRLRPRLRGAHAPRAGRGVVARRPPLGVRRPAGRQAAHAERRRRPGRGVGGRDGPRDAPRVRRGPAR